MIRSRLSQLKASFLITAVYWLKNYPIAIVSSFLAPVAIIFLIAFISKGALIGVAVEGALMSSFVINGFGLQHDIAHFKNDFKLQDMIVASPTSSLIYIAGMAGSGLVTAMPSVIFLLILWYFFIPTTIISAVAVAAVIFILFILAVSIGFLFSTRSNDIGQSYQYAGIVTIIFTTIAPVYYPITLIPLPYRYLAYLSPVTYAAEIIQSATGYLSLSLLNLAADWIVLIVLTVMIIALSVKGTRWREI